MEKVKVAFYDYLYYVGYYLSIVYFNVIAFYSSIQPLDV
jgi:hypothetical protein